MTPLRIIQGGQTGVDRGAWLAAKDLDLLRGGFMPHNRRDENGLIPRLVQADLAIHDGVQTLGERTIANVIHADAILIVVPDRSAARSTPGTALTVRTAERHGKPLHITDDYTPGSTVETAEWLGINGPFGDPQRWVDREFRLMVAGPRKSRWLWAEIHAYLVVRALYRQLHAQEKP